jgi:putative peptide zinc metalloprotease protein
MTYALRPRRLVTAALLALGAIVATAVPSYADGGDNVAVAVNTKDGFDIFKLAFQVRRATGDVIDNTNAAIAYASCTDCQTIALAIQIVLVSGTDASTVSPENVAIALNENCTLCDTLASAYQFVIVADGKLGLTGEGRRRLAEIRVALLGLRDSGLTAAEIQAKVDALMTELADVLSTELVVKTKAKDEPPSSAPPSETAEPSGSATPSTAPSESATPTPDDSATPTATASGVS